MGQESDISWQVLRRIVEEWQGTKNGAAEPDLAEVKPLYGGCINTTLALTLTDGRRAVLKISAHRVDRSYVREAYQLELLRKAGVPVPQVYLWHVGTLDDPYSYILMEYVDGVDWLTARREAGPAAFESLQNQLAALLLGLHETRGPGYGRSSEEEEPFREQWPEFYRDVYDPIWHDMHKSPLLGAKGRKVVDRVHEKLPQLICHDDCPRLVHWDLWGSNILAAPDAEGNWKIRALLDPNCKYAHYEAELAYLELFQTVDASFFKAYQRERKLPPDYHRFRKPVYQLYFMLNHVNLFGEKHAARLSAAVDKVAELV